MILVRPRATRRADLPEIRDTADLFQRHGQTVARWVARMGGRGVDVEDAVQEVFLVAHRRLDDFSVEAKVKSWLFRTAQKVVQDHRRRNRWWRRFVRDGEDAAERVASTRPTPVEDVERNENVAAAQRVLERMNDRYRTVLLLFELDEVPGDELASLMGVKLATLWVWLHRARQKFLAGMEEERLRG